MIYNSNSVSYFDREEAYDAASQVCFAFRRVHTCEMALFCHWAIWFQAIRVKLINFKKR